MDRDKIRSFLLENKEIYSLDSLKKQLINQGAKKFDVNSVVLELSVSNKFKDENLDSKSDFEDYVSNEKDEDVKVNDTLGVSIFVFIFSIASLFLGILGFIISIFVIVYCSKVRKKSTSNGLILASLVIGIISFIINLLLTVFLVLIFGSFFWLAFNDDDSSSNFSADFEDNLSFDNLSLINVSN